MHIHDLQVRYSDIDSNNHVNNVSYSVLAAEAREAMIAEGALDGADVVTDVALTYRRPVVFEQRDIRVESVFEEGVLTQDIHGHTTGGERFLAATMVTSSVEPRIDAAAEEQGREFRLPMRHRDFHGVDELPLERFAELVQEARVLYARSHGAALQAGTFVIGRVLLRLGAPLSWRNEPLVVRTWIGAVARSTVTITSQISDGTRIYATSNSVQVGIDRSTGSSRALSESEKEGLRALMP